MIEQKRSTVLFYWFVDYQYLFQLIDLREILQTTEFYVLNFLLKENWGEKQKLFFLKMTIDQNLQSFSEVKSVVHKPFLTFS